ncbi:uncharacterized protein LOC119733004 [Patiria miniata]|uniref:Uncharacterized protein n=1 Tax=Patiria miniata TaxID=46514 RepID=A0A914AFL1_PATMI|nr:uncharacterized protein LOC119733004 [Patiria miniata]
MANFDRVQSEKAQLSSSHDDITQHKGTTQQGISSTPTTKTVPVDANSNPKQNAELREQIAKSIIDDPATLKAIVDPIATLLADKIIDSGLMMGKLADSLVASKLFVDSIASAVQETIAQNVYEATSTDINKHSDQLEKMHNQNRKISDQNDQLKQEIGDLEQYSRRNCLLIHGIPETPNENTDKISLEVLNNKLKLDLHLHDLDRSHRLGKPRKSTTPSGAPQRPRPVIVKFTSYRSRSLVFANKRHLKGSSVHITENLTKRRHEPYQEARRCDGFEAVWTRDGKIILLLKNKTKTSITTLKELNKLCP